MNDLILRRNVIEDVTIETRAEVEGTREVIKGYFSVYNSSYPMMWRGYIERIAPGAFDGCDMSDVVCLYNHEDEFLIGRTYNGEGTLKISFDERGGYFEVDKPNTTTGNDVYENIRLKNIRGCSFAFTVAEDETEYDVPQADGSVATIVTIKRVKKLYDVGPVNNPAYKETEVEAAMRSADSKRPKQIDKQTELLNLKFK